MQHLSENVKRQGKMSFALVAKLTNVSAHRDCPGTFYLLISGHPSLFYNALTPGHTQCDRVVLHDDDAFHTPLLPRHLHQLRSLAARTSNVLCRSRRLS